MTSPIESPQGGLEVVIEAGCAYVTLVDRRMSWAMLNALKSLPSQLLDADVRCVVVRSNGLDFCHGIDLSDADLLEQVAAELVELIVPAVRDGQPLRCDVGDVAPLEADDVAPHGAGDVRNLHCELPLLLDDVAAEVPQLIVGLLEVLPLDDQLVLVELPLGTRIVQDELASGVRERLAHDLRARSSRASYP